MKFGVFVQMLVCIIFRLIFGGWAITCASLSDYFAIDGVSDKWIPSLWAWYLTRAAQPSSNLLRDRAIALEIYLFSKNRRFSR